MHEQGLSAGPGQDPGQDCSLYLVSQEIRGFKKSHVIALNSNSITPTCMAFHTPACQLRRSCTTGRPLAKLANASLTP